MEIWLDKCGKRLEINTPRRRSQPFWNQFKAIGSWVLLHMGWASVGAGAPCEVCRGHSGSLSGMGAPWGCHVEMRHGSASWLCWRPKVSLPRGWSKVEGVEQAAGPRLVSPTGGTGGWGHTGAVQDVVLRASASQCFRSANMFYDAMRVKQNSGSWLLITCVNSRCDNPFTGKRSCLSPRSPRVELAPARKSLLKMCLPCY